MLRQTTLVRSQAIVNDITAHIAMLTELILENIGDPDRIPPPLRKLRLYHHPGVRRWCCLLMCSDLTGVSRSRILEV